MSWFRKNNDDINEFCDWLDVNFGHAGLRPVSVATGTCGVVEGEEMMIGESLVTSKIATFLHNKNRRQIYIKWFDRRMKNLWLNWPVGNQTLEYRKETIKMFNEAIKLYNEFH